MKVYPFSFLYNSLVNFFWLQLASRSHEVNFYSFADLALFSHSLHNVLVADSGKQKEGGNKENQHL